MIYKILKYGEPLLEVKCDPIAPEEFGQQPLQQLVANMFATMYAAKGVGLAAPQIGISKRLTVIDPSAGEDPAQRVVLINPEILSKEGSLSEEEGCLSIPGFREPVTRARKTTVRALDETGKSFELTGEDLLSRAIQHEYDHLDGVLFIHRLSPLKRDIIRRKIRKLQKAGEWD